MGEARPVPASEIDAIRGIYAALNRGDVAGFVSLFDPAILRVEFEGLPGGGTYRGLAEVEAHVAKARGTWAEGSCEPERFVVAAGDRVVVLVRVRVRLKDEAAWREGRVADGFAFRGGKVVEFRTFAKEGEAFEWAGVEVPEAK